MAELKRGSNGGKVMAIYQKQQAQARKEEYDKNPNLCAECQDPIYSAPHEKLRYTKRKKCCSRRCAGVCANRKRGNHVGTSEDYQMNSSVKMKWCKECKIIRVPFTRQYCAQCNENRKFARQKYLAFGERTKEELRNRAKGYPEYRASIQWHARKVFYQEYSGPVCLICTYSLHVHVAHIQSVSEFADQTKLTEINAADNLVALCPNHHWEFDHGILSKKDVRKITQK
jgi:hypothetical protein